ncbi:BRCT domain containing protein [Gracilaria domingensis]|nr:BRCT domain containing protein [Gracilaria domingensis]
MSAAVRSAVTSFQSTGTASMLSRKRKRPPPLQGCSLCVSDVGDDDAAQIAGQVRRMGGEFSDELRPTTTHLVSEKAGSAMHRAVC